MEGDVEARDVAPPADSKLMLLPAALGGPVLHQALPDTRAAQLRTGRGRFVDNGN